MFKKITLVTAMLFATSGAALAADFNVAANVANVPFEFEDGQGKLSGFEVELLQLVAKRLHKSIEFTPMPFNSLFAAVQSGRANVAIGSITVTKKRLESVAFTQPYIDANQCLTVATKSGIRDLDGLKGKQVAVVTGTTGEMWATENQTRYMVAGISRYDSTADPMLDIATGRIAGLVNDCANDAYYIRDKPQYTIVTSIPTHEQLALMFPKNSPMLKEVDATLSKLKQDGEIAKLYRKWFGTLPPQNSSTVTVLPIPQS
ncbi:MULTISPECIES: ABC transporter substrate-binding protein [Burkholderia]|uniref:ABC transporter substrate-binding protein n=1 Tax=Burkholderia TaxID=32008 RepID=UPI00064FCAA0|nr:MULTISPECIES: ABC transporter substrate-binding protein [Burkholderia]KML19718.1 ABC transporter substrate-binding protein [Burkholderia cepacia]KMN59560.1 ABC transporter substrate-binding protein [Burkholderia sp. LK4]